MKKLSIENLTNRPVTFILPHQSVCIKIGRCLCKNGMPQSIHVKARGLVTGLPVEYALAPDIQEAANAKPRPTVRLVVKEATRPKPTRRVQAKDQTSEKYERKEPRRKADRSAE